MFGKFGMLQTVSIGAVILAVAGWAIYTQTDLIRPAPVVEASDAPLAVEAEPDTSEAEESEPVVEAEADEDESPTVDSSDTEESEEPGEASQDVSAEEVEEAVAEDEAEVEEEVEAEPQIAAPAFDVVRVEADGMTVIAGTGPAGWMIAILVDGVVVETVEADATGQFVAILDIGESEAARVITLSAKNADQIVLSDAQVIIAPVVRQVAAVEETPTQEGEVEASDEEEVASSEDSEVVATDD